MHAGDDEAVGGCVTESTSVQVAPPSTQARRAPGSTSTARIPPRSTTSAPSATALPATLCRPPRTVIGSSCSRAKVTAATSAVLRQRAMSAGCVSGSCSPGGPAPPLLCQSHSVDRSACRGAVPAQYSASEVMRRLSASSLNRALKGVEVDQGARAVQDQWLVLAADARARRDQVPRAGDVTCDASAASTLDGRTGRDDDSPSCRGQVS